MRRVLITALAATALGFATPALAAVTVTPDPTGTPLANQIFGISAPDAIHEFGSAPNNDNSGNVEFTGNTDLHITAGFAQVSDGGTVQGDLNEIIINPNDLFTKFEFATQLEGTAGTVYVYYLLAGSGLDANLISSYISCGNAFCGLAGTYISGTNDNANYLLQGGTFDGFMVATSDSTFSLFQAKQLSYLGVVAPVPEPGTWGLMLLGFAGIGMALRRGRKQNGRLLQIA